MDNQYCIDITVPTESTVGLNEVKSYASIYPNPTNNTIEIESKKSIVLMQLSNHHGQLVRSVATTGLYHKHQLNELLKGIYFMELSYKNGQKSHHKIILQ